MRGAEGPEHCIYLSFLQKQKKLYYCLKVINMVIRMWHTHLRKAKVKPKACNPIFVSLFILFYPLY